MDKNKCREFFKTYCDDNGETEAYVPAARELKATRIYNRVRLFTPASRVGPVLTPRAADPACMCISLPHTHAHPKLFRVEG